MFNLFILLATLIIVMLGLLARTWHKKIQRKVNNIQRNINAELTLQDKAKQSLNQTKIELEERILLKTSALQKSYIKLNNMQDRLKTHNLKLNEKTHIDPLTKIANRRHFDQRFDSELRRAIRDRHALTLVFADIDHFDDLMKTDGPLYGDYVVKKVAASIKNKFKRAGDIVARIDQKTFAVVLPATERTSATALTNQMRDAVINSNIKHDAHTSTNHVTLSAGGVTLFPERDTHSEDILLAATKALHRAKNAGCNRTVFVDFI